MWDIRVFCMHHWKTVGYWPEIMLGVYTTHVPEAKEPINLQEAHDHMWGTETQPRCERCYSSFERRVAYQLQFVR